MSKKVGRSEARRGDASRLIDLVLGDWCKRYPIRVGEECVPKNFMREHASLGRRSPEFAGGSVDAGVVRRPGAWCGPEELAVSLKDWTVVDTRLPAPHQAPRVKFPQFVTITPEPIAHKIVPLVFEVHRDPIGGERPQALDKNVP